MSKGMFFCCFTLSASTYITEATDMNFSMIFNCEKKMMGMIHIDELLGPKTSQTNFPLKVWKSMGQMEQDNECCKCWCFLGHPYVCYTARSLTWKRF